MKSQLLITIAAALLWPSAAFAQTTAAPAPPQPALSAQQQQNDAFLLGYALGYSRLKAYDFIEAVKQLDDTDDDDTAGTMVAHLIDQGEASRRLEGAALSQSATLIAALNGPDKTRQWAASNAAELVHPVAIKLKRDETDEQAVTDRLSAIIFDTSRVQKEANSTLDALGTVLLASDGPPVPWAVNLGAYTAKLAVWDGDSTEITALQAEVQHLVDTEPAATPPAVDQTLRSILPAKPQIMSLQSGAGNLAALLPSHIQQIAADAIHAAPRALLSFYAAYDAAKQLAATP